MDWMIWILVSFSILILANGKVLDEDAELKESFYRLLDYSDEFDEFMHTQKDKRYDDDNDDDQFDPDDERIRNALPQEILDSISSRRQKKKETLSHIHNSEKKQQLAFKKSEIVQPKHNNIHTGNAADSSLRKKDTQGNSAFKKSDIRRPEHSNIHADNELKKKVAVNEKDAHVNNNDIKSSQNNLEFQTSDPHDLSLESVKSLNNKKSDASSYEGRTIVEEVNAPDVTDKRDENNNPAVAAATIAPSVTLPKSHVESTKKDTSELNDVFFIVIIVACSLACIAGLALAGYCWYRLRRDAKEIEADETSPFTGGKPDDNKLKKSDEKLAKSAEMYHYVHSKNQLTALQPKDGGKGQAKNEASDSSEDESESDNTIYECSGLAPPGDMKVVNPLFSDVDNRQSDTKSEGSVSPSRDIQYPSTATSPGPTGGASTHNK